jgi:ankyrin repeat protein
MSSLLSQFLITETTSGVTLCNTVCKGHGTALHGAAKNGKTTVVDVLLNARVSLDVKDSEERTPIHLAAQKGHLE